MSKTEEEGEEGKKKVVQGGGEGEQRREERAGSGPEGQRGGAGPNMKERDAQQAAIHHHRSGERETGAGDTKKWSERKLR